MKKTVATQSQEPETIEKCVFIDTYQLFSLQIYTNYLFYRYIPII